MEDSLRGYRGHDGRSQAFSPNFDGPSIGQFTCQPRIDGDDQRRLYETLGKFRFARSPRLAPRSNATFSPFAMLGSFRHCV